MKVPRRIVELIAACVLFVAGAVSLTYVFMQDSPRPVAMKIVQLIETHPEEWTPTPFSSLENEERGISIYVGEDLDQKDLVVVARRIAVRVDDVDLPGFGGPHSGSKDQIAIKKAIQRWHHNMVADPKQKEEAAAIAKVLAEPVN